MEEWAATLVGGKGFSGNRKASRNPAWRGTNLERSCDQVILMLPPIREAAFFYF
jgi:hypothetical protein